MSTRLFRTLLLLITVIGLVIRIYVGLHTSISFDEWQHVFMASGPRWADLSFELTTNAHPPLFFILLNCVRRLGCIELFRAISIAAGAGSIVLVGLIAQKSLSSPVVSLLCAFSFALSADAISISCEIRSYQLAIFFVLAASLAWLPMALSAGDPPKISRCLAFSLLASLAVMTHYASVFFLGACIATLPLPSRYSLRAVLALSIPCAIFAVAYFIHAGAQPIQGYLFSFYHLGTPKESALSFFGRNLRNFLNLFSISPIRNEGVTAILVAIGLVVALVTARKRRQTMIVVVTAIAIVFEIAVAGLANKYPFGGLLRHQYIAGPFLLLTAFAILDSLLLASRLYLHYAVVAILLIASTANLTSQWPSLILYPGSPLLLQAEFDSWRSAFPQARAVFVDHWGIIGYFIHTSTQARHFVQTIAASATIDQYSLPDGTDVFYDKTHDVLDFLDASTYQSIAACLRQSEIKDLSLFFFSPGDTPFNTPPAELGEIIRRQASLQGVFASHVLVTQTTVLAQFALAQQ